MNKNYWHLSTPKIIGKEIRKGNFQQLTIQLHDWNGGTGIPLEHIGIDRKNILPLFDKIKVLLENYNETK